jgi:hypothetical protein
MTKRSLKQIEESLRSKFAENSDDDLINSIKSMDDPYHLGGRGQPQQIDIGLGGAARTGTSKPRVSLQKAKELGIIKPDPKVWRKASDIPTLTDVIPPRQPKVWRRGEPESIAPPPQTAQEKLVAQAQQRAKETGEPTLAVTSPWASKILDRLFPEKLSDLAKQRIEPKLDEDNKQEYSKDDYINWAKKYAEQYKVPVPMVLHAMFKETGWLKDPEKMRTATSPTGAKGIMQIQPEYAEKGAYKIKVKDLTDPEKNIEAGVRGLAYYLNKHKTPEKALAAYNAGEGGAANFLKTGDIKFLPKETKKYIQGYKDDIVHQLEKFYPKNKEKVAQVANNILATAVGAKDVQAADEIPKPSKQKSKPVGSTYTTTDTQGKTTTYTKDSTGQWVSATGEIMPMPTKPSVSSANAAAPSTDSFVNKLKRAASGELVSQAFGDKKKPDSVPVKSVATNTTQKSPNKPDSYFSRKFASDPKNISVAAAVPLLAPAMALSDVFDYDIKTLWPQKDEPAKPKTTQSVSGKIEYPKKANAVAKPEKPSAAVAAPKIELQKDQTGLVKAKKELSDFEKAFAAARAEQGAGGTFSYTNPKTGKTGMYTTSYKGEKSQSKPEVAAMPDTEPTDRFKSATSEPPAPESGELNKAVQSFVPAQDSNKTVPQSDEPDEIEKIIKAKQTDVTPDAPMPTDAEIEAAKVRSRKHLADIERELADKALVKESINTESNADLHDILKLAGRLK